MSKIKNIAKRIVPRSAVWRYRIMRGNLPYINLLQKIRSKEIRNANIIFGTPLHDNLGDHLITLAESYFIQDSEEDSVLIEIPLEFYRLYSNEIKEGIDSSSCIFINGGGWMGDVWPEDEIVIQSIVESFPDNKIIIFPQTVYFAEENDESLSLKSEGARIYGEHNKLTMFFRERNSYQLAKKIYKDSDVRIAPDMALYYLNRAPKRKKIQTIVGLCLRDDKEKTQNQALSSLIGSLDESRIETKVISTIYDGRVSEADRERVVTSVLQDFSTFGVVITDRLHAMLFCYLTDTPCVVFDNATKKISGVYEEWLKGSASVFPVFSEDETELDDIMSFIRFSMNTLFENQFSEHHFDAIRSILDNERN